VKRDDDEIKSWMRAWTFSAPRRAEVCALALAGCSASRALVCDWLDAEDADEAFRAYCRDAARRRREGV
jgi:hypothetical protein